MVGQEDDLSNNLKSLGMKTVMISFKVLSEIFLQGALKVMLVSLLTDSTLADLTDVTLVSEDSN